MSYKVAPLTVNPKQKSTLTSKAFVSQPSAEEELLVGRLFVLMEIDQSRADDFALADFIVKEIYKHYYENEQFFLRDKIANLKIDYIFEAALTKLNHGIAEFLETQKMALRPGSLNIVIGVLHKNRLLFAHTGANKAMLLYRPKPKANGVILDYNLLDISEKTQDPTQELATQQKLFANVVNGQIPSQGYFLFANEAVLEYLSKKQLLDIISTLPPTSAAEQIKLLLEQTDAFVPFFALIVKNTSGEEYAIPQGQPSEVAAAPLGGQGSVERLNLTQEKTEQLLSPSGLLTIKKWFNRIQPQTATIKSFAQGTARQLNLATSRLNSRRSSWNLGQKSIDVLRVIASVGADAIRAAFSWITNAEARRSSMEKARAAFRRLLLAARAVPERFSRLTLRNKILLSVIVLCIIGFAGNLIYGGITAQRKAAAARLSEVQSSFEQKEHQLEASLLYGNTEGARTLVEEMGALLNGLPNKTESDKAALADLTTRYQTRLDSLFAVTRLKNPAAFAVLPAAADSLALAGGALYAPRGESKNVYAIDANGQVATLTYDGFSGSAIRASQDDGTAYFWDGTALVRYSAADAFKKAVIEDFPAGTSDAVVYNTRLYAVSLSDKSVYRFNQDKKTFSFSNRQAWNKDAITLPAVSSLSIDGRIYLTGDKQIKKMAGGYAENLTLDPTTPALEEPTAAVASPDLNYLYVLEPSKKRLLIYTDDGKYLAQYTSDAFDNLHGLALDEANKKMYLLSGQNVYRLDAVHIVK